MRPNPVPLIAALFCAYTSFAQTDERYRLTLGSESFIPEKNITTEKISELNRSIPRIDNKGLLIIQFDRIPSVTDRQRLAMGGIELKEYVSNNSYTAIVTGTINPLLLNQVNARSLVRLNGKHKLQHTLANGIVPSWATRAPGTVDLWINIPAGIDMASVYRDLGTRNFEMLSTELVKYGIIALRVASSRINEVAELPYVEFVQPAPKDDEALNNNNISGTKANILNSTLPGGRALKGEGVVVGVGDDSNPMNHIDFNSRMINRAWAPGGSHGVHVMGTVGGAGIVQEKYTGFAPKSKMIAQVFSNILTNSPVYVQDYGMVITNNYLLREYRRSARS